VNQGAMKIQQRRWFECNRRLQETVRPDPQRAQAGDQSVPYAQIGRTSAGAIHDQQLMFDENRFRNHRPQTSRLGDPENGRNEMEQKNDQIAHARMVTREEDDGLWPNLEFASHRLKLYF